MDKEKEASMKKKVLFVMESLRIGGAEKSLLTILSMFDTKQYDVDLCLFRHSGEFMDFLPECVHLLPLDEKFHLFDKSRKGAPFAYLKQGKLAEALHSVGYLAEAAVSKVAGKKLYIGWHHQKHFFQPIEQKYDVAIAFMERRSIYFVTDWVKADKKIGFIHNDYSVYPYDEKQDQRCFAAFDHIATVSEHCMEVLQEKFPLYRDKFLVIKNMVSPSVIRQMAQEDIGEFPVRQNALKIVSVGRLTRQKGFDNAIRICKKLCEKGMDVCWYIAGKGEQQPELERLIAEMQLENHMFLVGAQVNPYKWMQMCDVYVQPSRFEGFGITVAEAKVLGKKIVAADIPEFREQLSEYPYARLVSQIEEYCQGICELQNVTVDEKNLKEDTSNQELEKLYEIM